jgi:hypothetical protein
MNLELRKRTQNVFVKLDPVKKNVTVNAVAEIVI